MILEALQWLGGAMVVFSLLFTAVFIGSAMTERIEGRPRPPSDPLRDGDPP